jgi:hypothetical protein
LIECVRKLGPLTSGLVIFSCKMSLSLHFQADFGSWMSLKSPCVEDSVPSVALLGGGRNLKLSCVCEGGAVYNSGGLFAKGIVGF